MGTKAILMGNEAIARGIVEAGCEVAAIALRLMARERPGSSRSRMEEAFLEHGRRRSPALLGKDAKGGQPLRRLVKTGTPFSMPVRFLR